MCLKPSSGEAGNASTRTSARFGRFELVSLVFAVKSLVLVKSPLLPVWFSSWISGRLRFGSLLWSSRWSSTSAYFVANICS